MTRFLIALIGSLVVAMVVKGQNSGDNLKCQPRTMDHKGSVKFITVQPTWPGGLTELRGMITENIYLRCTKNTPVSNTGCQYCWRVWFERVETRPPTKPTQSKAYGIACASERKDSLITVGNFRVEPTQSYVAYSNIYAGNCNNVIGLPLSEATYYFKPKYSVTPIVTPPLYPVVGDPKYPGDAYPR